MRDLRSILLFAVALALLLLKAADALAAAPASGETISGEISIGLGKRIPLPPGQFKVVASFGDPVKVTNDGGAFFTAGSFTRAQSTRLTQRPTGSHSK